MNENTVKNFYSVMKSGDIKTIREEYQKFILSYTNYCDEFLGEGFFGRVTAPNFGPTVFVKVGDKYISLPTAVKELKHRDDVFEIIETNGKLYFMSSKSITSEMIILFMVSKLWYDGRTPHIPFLLGVDSCGDNGYGSISKIVTERHGIIPWNDGMEKPIIKLDNYVTPFLVVKRDRISNMAILDDLLLYCVMNRENDTKIKLPNGIEAYIPDLVDYLFISFVHTTHILSKELGLIISDQHPQNIFIHWLNKYSYMGKNNLTNIKNIYYQIGKDKYIKCPTYGLLLKIGDVGTSIMRPHKNVYVVGDIYDPHQNIKDLEKYNKYIPSYADMFMNVIGGILPISISSLTRVWKLANREPFNTLTYFGTPSNKKMPTDIEVLNMNEFKDMVVDSATTNDENLVVLS